MFLRSWVPKANARDTDFPIQNLPYGIFETAGDAKIGVAIGDSILDLKACADVGWLDDLGAETIAACEQDSLNALMALGPKYWSPLRRTITGLLADRQDSKEAQVTPLLVPMSAATMVLPARIGDYTDFFASLYHATNAGSLFRTGNPLFPNYKYVPIGYHGRASSVVVSGSPVRRPSGQILDKDAGSPRFGSSNALDYEMEVGAFVGHGNLRGEPISLDEAPSHIFGLCLLNDWSARDIQAWESQPLGPFLSKSFATSISPWVVPMEALEPFRIPAFARAEGDPDPLPYLYSKPDQQTGGIDLTVEVYIETHVMREASQSPHRLSRGNLRDLYWTLGQLLAHHTSNGCNLRPGDLFGTGTVSGPEEDSWGCLLEITRRGQEPISLPNGEQRRYLQDGDQVILRGYCERPGQVRIGFGECRGIVGLPAVRD